MADARPPHFAPGTPIGAHYKVEGLVRLSEGRFFYLANDARDDLPTRRCWECDHRDSPRGTAACAACGAPFKDRRFLVSSRWDKSGFEAYEQFHALGLDHPGLAAPVDVFRIEDQLISVVPYDGEGLMLDEAAPLSNARILDVGQRIAGTLAFLHVNGVRLAQVTRANLLIAPDNQLRLFDLDVEEVRGEALDATERSGELRTIGELLRRYCDVEAEALAQFMETVEEGSYPNPAAFGRAVEQRFDAFGGLAYGPNLAGMTDVGLVRQLNEDTWGWRKLSNRAKIYLVADGMGGHEGGEVASALAIKTMALETREREPAIEGDLDEIEAMVELSFRNANNAVKDEAEVRGTDMGTTLVSLLTIDDKVGFFSNVGDSRAYLWRNSQLHQVTKDHSLVAKMVERGRITEEEARHHPHSNILLRTVGTERDVDVDVFRVELEPGDRAIMCSDGLWGEVEDRDIEGIMNTYSDPRIAVRELVRAAHHGGGKDNVTLVIVTVPG